jgi:TolB protein
MPHNSGMKNHITKIFILTFSILLISFPAFARIQITIDEMGDKKFPIAVPKMVTDKGRSAGGTGRKMVELLKLDLSLAGLFRVVDEADFPFDKDSDVSDIDFTKWKALEVGALIKAVQMKKSYQFRLYDVATGKQVLGKEYEVKGSNYIDAVHRFVDDTMEVLTGYRGPFESKIIASCGKPFKRRLKVFEMDGQRSYNFSVSGVNPISPNWAPDGKQITYSAFPNPEHGMEIYTSDGKDSRQLTNYNTTSITPVWLPDGKSIAFSSTKDGDAEIYRMNTKGKILAQLTNSRNIDLSPSISPSGQLAFASERAGDLHLFSSGSRHANRLTYVGYQNDQPDWSPDGRKIAFTSRDKGAFDIFVMDGNGSNIQRLTRLEGNNEAPSWAPDSRYLVFASDRGGLYVMLDDGRFQTLIEGTEGCVNPDWGPRLSE